MAPGCSTSEMIYTGPPHWEQINPQLRAPPPTGLQFRSDLLQMLDRVPEKPQPEAMLGQGAALSLKVPLRMIFGYKYASG